MTKSEIENMLLDIINNGAEYECRPIGKCSHCVKCRLCDWRDYELGDEIHDNYEYRKKDIWHVINDYPNEFLLVRNPHKLSILSKSKFKGTKEECEKWIKENVKKTFLKELNSKISPNAKSLDFKVKETATEVCKKILDEIDNLSSYDDPNHVKSVVESIIENLGINVD